MTLKRNQIYLTMALICSLTATSSTLFAQEVEDEDLLELVEPGAESTSSSGAQVQENKNSSKNNVEAAPAALTEDEKKSLAEARKSKSEAAMLRVTSEILSRDPINLFALNSLAVFYFETKKYGLAKIILKRAMKDHPKESALHNNLGVIYLAENDLQLALESLKRSVDMRTDYEIGAANLSSIYLEYRDYQRGLNALSDAFKSRQSDLRRGKPEAIEIANNYAIALMGVGEKDKASEVFEDIYDSPSRNPAPVLNYILFLVEVEKNKKSASKAVSKLKLMTEDREIIRRAEELVSKLE